MPLLESTSYPGCFVFKDSFGSENRIEQGSEETNATESRIFRLSPNRLNYLAIAIRQFLKALTKTLGALQELHQVRGWGTGIPGGGPKSHQKHKTSGHLEKVLHDCSERINEWTMVWKGLSQHHLLSYLAYLSTGFTPASVALPDCTYFATASNGCSALSLHTYPPLDLRSSMKRLTLCRSLAVRRAISCWYFRRLVVLRLIRPAP